MTTPVEATDAIMRVGEYIAGLLPLLLLAALGGVVRSMQAGRCGLKAVITAAISAGFAGVVVHLLLQSSGLPLGLQAAMVGISGYASGELLKILAVRLCKWADAAMPAKPETEGKRP